MPINLDLHINPPPLHKNLRDRAEVECAAVVRNACEGWVSRWSIFIRVFLPVLAMFGVLIPNPFDVRERNLTFQHSLQVMGETVPPPPIHVSAVVM